MADDLNITVDAKTAHVLKLFEFDRDIAKAEQTVADLKHSKAEFIYQTAAEGVIRKHNAEQQLKSTSVL